MSSYTNFNDIDYDQIFKDIDKIIMDIEQPKPFKPTVRWRLVGKAAEKGADIKKGDSVTCITEIIRNDNGQLETVITDIAKVN